MCRFSWLQTQQICGNKRESMQRMQIWQATDLLYATTRSGKHATYVDLVGYEPIIQDKKVGKACDVRRFSRLRTYYIGQKVRESMRHMQIQQATDLLYRTKRSGKHATYVDLVGYGPIIQDKKVGKACDVCRFSSLQTCLLLNVEWEILHAYSGHQVQHNNKNNQTNKKHKKQKQHKKNPTA